MQGGAAETIVQVLAHAAAFHGGGQVGLAGGQEPRHVIARGICHAHDARLDFVGNVADLVDQQRTPVRGP